jgi:hypothetical protein
MKPAKKKLVPNTSSVTERWKKKVAIKKTKILQAIAVSENSGYTTGTDPAPTTAPSFVVPSSSLLLLLLLLWPEINHHPPFV